MVISAPALPLNPEAVQKLEYYVKERQKTEGGFGLTPGLPATVEDTFYAVRILELLERDQQLDQTRVYLARLGRSQGQGARIIFALLYLQRKFGLGRGPLPRLTPRPRTLEEALYCQKIKELLGGGCQARGLDGCQPGPVALPAAFTVKDLRCYLALQRHNLGSAAVARWTAWVLACQSPDGGFGFKPGTTAFMDNVLPALEILGQLGRTPLDGRGVVDFILACQTQAGGFARKTGGVAFLESSFQAVRSLHLLSQILAPKMRLRTIDRIRPNHLEI
jgi:hypothetical protein